MVQQGRSVEALPTDVTTFLLDGVAAQVGDHEHLLSALREELHVTSVKDGCAPMGQCGCTVLIDGRAVLACRTSLARVEDRSVVTLEGLDEGERCRVAEAFTATGAAQCGFCTPGILLRAKDLLDSREGDGLRTHAANRLGTHLCRCGGYGPILDAIDLLAACEIAMPEPIEGHRLARCPLRGRGRDAR